MCGNVKAIGRLEAFELFTNRFSALKLLKDRCRKLNIKIPYMFLLFAGILSIISTLQGILTPYLYSLLVDDVMVGGKIELLFGIILKMVVLFLVNILIAMLSTYLNVRFSNCVSVLMRMNLFRKILKKNFSALKKEDLGKQQELILNDSAIVSGFLMVQIKDFVCSLLFVVVYICMMLWVSKWLTLVSLITIPLVSIWGRYVGKKLNESQLKLWEVGSKNSTNIYNTFQRWREVKIQGLEDDLTGKYKESLKPEKDINLVWMLYYAIDGVVYEIKNSFVQNLVPYFVGGLLIIQNQLTIGALLMFITYLSNLSVHIDMILTSITNFESNRAAFARVFETLEIEEEKCDERLSCPSNCGIEIENISFSYDTSLPMIFDNANYTFESRKTYLISGKSGGGKSTLIKLILGVVSPTFGEIKYGGVLLENMDSQSLFKHLGIIMQESYFFNFSILENLTLLNENVTEDDVKMACKLACISEYIESLPEKYDTLIGERGIKLSGGQRQRLAIARMILHNPDIIIMDEATSSLDNKCEAEILQNLEKKFAEKMIIMISHKPDIEFGFYKKIRIVDRGIKEVYE